MIDFVHNCLNLIFPEWFEFLNTEVLNAEHRFFISLAVGWKVLEVFAEFFADSYEVKHEIHCHYSLHHLLVVVCVAMIEKVAQVDEAISLASEEYGTLGVLIHLGKQN